MFWPLKQRLRMSGRALGRTMTLSSPVPAVGLRGTECSKAASCQILPS